MRISSFKHAICGIARGIKHEKNFKFMCICLLLVLAANILLNVTKLDWIITLCLSTLVLSMELINSSIEKTVDLVTKETHELAKHAKDFAAGGVLVASIVAAIVAGIVYVPYLAGLFR